MHAICMNSSAIWLLLHPQCQNMLDNSTDIHNFTKLYLPEHVLIGNSFELAVVHYHIFFFFFLLQLFFLCLMYNI